MYICVYIYIHRYYIYVHIYIYIYIYVVNAQMIPVATLITLCWLQGNPSLRSPLHRPAKPVTGRFRIRTQSYKFQVPASN